MPCPHCGQYQQPCRDPKRCAFAPKEAVDCEPIVTRTIPGTVLVEERNVFGTIKMYPANAVACDLAALAGTTTLTPSQIERIKAIGFQVRTLGKFPRTL